MVREQIIELTVKEFEIFALLIMNPKRVFTYEMLMDLVWNEDYTYYSRKAVNNHVSNLRKKLKVAANLPDYVVSKERCQALLKEIERMPENWRQVATLRLIEGRPTREVCAMLNITEKACYSRVSRIRKYLEELLKSDNWP